MEDDNDFKEEIKISKNDGDNEENNNLIEKKNLYLKLGDDYHLEDDLNDNNDIGIEIDNDIFMNNNQENFSDLTQYQIERLNQIRQEAQLRSEKYSELSTMNSNINSKSTNVISNTKNNLNNDANDINDINDNIDDMSQLNNNFINNDCEDNQIKEINPNLDRFFDEIHPFFFINNEPFIVIGPDALHFIIVFTISSLLSIIFYSIKKNTYFIMKSLYLLAYLLYITSYTLLMILNPGIPTNKNNIDLEELKRNYKQCNICNCISSKNSDYITFHCNKCNICVEEYTHHCYLASKCVGKKNKLIFKIWLFSIPFYLIIIFLYIFI